MATTTRDYLDYLDQEIGIAPANSQEELQAAQTIADIFEAHDLQATIQEFSAPSSAKTTLGILRIVLFVGALLSGLAGVARVVGVLLALASAALLLLDAFGNDVVRRYGPQAKSQNVIACHRASGPLVAKGNRPIVIVAHYDTPHEDFLQRIGFARYRPLLTRISAYCIPITAVLALTQAFVFLPEGLRRFTWVLCLIAALSVLLIGVNIVSERFMPCTPGSNDNKAALASMLGVLEYVRPKPEIQWAIPDEPSQRGRSLDDEPVNEMTDESAYIVGGDVVDEEAEQWEAPEVDAAAAQELPEGYVRHGKDVLESLGMLPATCDVAYVDAPAKPETPTEGKTLRRTPAIVPSARQRRGTRDEERLNQHESGETNDDYFVDHADFADQASMEDDVEFVDDAYADDSSFGDAFGGIAAEASNIFDRIRTSVQSLFGGPSEELYDEMSDVDEQGMYADELAVSEPSSSETLDELPLEGGDVVEGNANLEFDAGEAEVLDKGLEDMPHEQTSADEFSNVSSEEGYDDVFVTAEDGLSGDVFFDGEPYEGESYEEEFAYEEDAPFKLPFKLPAFIEKLINPEPVTDEVFEDELMGDEGVVDSFAGDEELRADADNAEIAQDEEVPLESSPEQGESVDGAEAAVETEPVPVPEPVAEVEAEAVAEPEAEPTRDVSELDLPVTREVTREDDSSEPIVIAAPDQDSITLAPSSNPNLREAFGAEVVEANQPTLEQELVEESVYDEQHLPTNAEVYSEEEVFADESYVSDEAAFEFEQGGSLGDMIRGAFSELRYLLSIPADDSPVRDFEEQVVEESSGVSDVAITPTDEPFVDDVVVAQDGAETSFEVESMSIEGEPALVQDTDPTLSAAPIADELMADEPTIETEALSVAPLNVPDIETADDAPTAQPVDEAIVAEVGKMSSSEDEGTVGEIDTGGLHITGNEDLIDSNTQVDTARPKPENPDDPSWGVSTFTPSAANVARRAALFDLPDPSADEIDPLGMPVQPEIEPEASPLENTSAGEPLPDLGPAMDTFATMEAIPDSEHFDTNMPVGRTRISELETPERRRFRLFGRKEQPSTSMSEWLGVDEDFDAKEEGKSIGSWENFSDNTPPDGEWKGGAAPSARLRLVDEAYTGEELPSEQELREAILGMGDDELIAHDIWFVALGASGAEHAGIQAFLDEYRTSCRGSFVINLDCIGSGELSILSSEGLATTRRADKRVSRLLSSTASDLHIPLVSAPFNWADTDVTPAMRASMRSVTIAGLDESGCPAFSGSMEDLPENIIEEQVQDVADLVAEAIRRS